MKRRLIFLSLLAGAVLFALVFLIFNQESDVNERIQGKTPRLGGQTRLHLACERADVLEVRDLLSRGADPGITDGQGRTPIFYVVGSDEEETKVLECMRLLIDSGANPDARMQGASTPLHLAASIGRAERVSLLLSFSADVNARTLTGETPLYLACSYSREANGMTVVEVLLSAGADPEIRNKDGESSVMVAKRKGHNRIVARLEKRK